jgi:hypothetical protein
MAEVEFGNVNEARKAADIALGASRGREELSRFSVILARAGAIAESQKLIDESKRRFPLNTLTNGLWIPTASAAVEISRNNAAKAISLLQSTTPYELGDLLGFGYLPLYLRAQAYLDSKNSAKAATEFQRILDHQGLEISSPLYALSHLGLARSLTLAGDSVNSRKAYQDFFSLWKEADPDIPILIKAKEEYQKLR